MNRIAKCFSELKKENRAGLVTFITAGDPDKKTSQKILDDLPNSGADIIELGMPFSDPMADGSTIQMASQRSLSAEGSMDTTFEMVKSFRSNDTKTPLILMGYYNPIHTYGTERFAKKASESGVDGLIVVDLPPEEDQELRDPLSDTEIDLIRLITPTTDDDRLTKVLEGAGGFLYYVSITGVTGAISADVEQLKPRLDYIRGLTDLPIAIGFGIKTPDDASLMGSISDAVVVGSSIVENIGKVSEGKKEIQDISNQVTELAKALRN